MTGPLGAAADPADTGLDVVTGAFGYSGSVIARRLLESGRRVRTLTGHPGRAAEGSPVAVRPLDFGDPAALARSLEGATVLYSTYWTRFAEGGAGHDLAVANCRILFEAARRAGVRRIVHVSITNPSPDSPYSYFRGKALAERALADAGVPFALVRPAIVFGGRGVLLENVAWLLRRLPVFAVGGRGDYRVRPVHVDDLARLCVEKGSERDDGTIDAVGPERPTFFELVASVRAAVGSRARLLRVPGPAVVALSGLVGAVLRDVLLTPEEYRAMAAGLADTDGPATGGIALSEWLAAHGETLGRRFVHDVRRRDGR